MPWSASAVYVHEVMTADPVTGDPDAVALEVLLELVRRNIHHLPLVDGEQVVGMITATDLLRLEQANPVHLAGEASKAPDVAGVAVQHRRCQIPSERHPGKTPM